jgi:hypothetical protein
MQQHDVYTHRRSGHRAPACVYNEVQPSLPVHVHEHARVWHFSLGPECLFNMHAVTQQAAGKPFYYSLRSSLGSK